MSEPQIFNVVIGTSGHIDHGKSSLVRCLTGVDPDRLPEEQDRGLTIDLGFAPLKLPDGNVVGIIDVPGHERFIKNMVAGASGIDLVVLVVAADDSVMPQTREHLDIMTLLGLQRGLVAINKIDLVEPDLVELVEEEVNELLEGTFLEGSPCFRVSAETGEGIDTFRDALFAAIGELPGRETSGVFRMPIQRVFSAKGFGTVVTGVPVSGSVAVGDQLEILPLDKQTRVRGIQAYKQTVTTARAGHSTAINLSDVDYRDVHRGMVIATQDYFRATDMVEAKLRVLPDLRVPLYHQMAVRFHTGTVETVGRLYLLDRKTAEPGEETFAQFRLVEPVVVAPGDRYVFRQQTPMVTLGGGEILDRSSWRLKLGKQYVLESLERKEAALGSEETFVLSTLQESPYQLVKVNDVARRAGLPRERAREILSQLQEQGEVIDAGGGNSLVRTGVDSACGKIIEALQGCYEHNRYRVSVPKLEVNQRARLPVDFFDKLLQQHRLLDHLNVHSGGRLSLPGREVELGSDGQAAYDLLETSYRDQLFTPPRLDELASTRSTPLDLLERVHALLLDQELLVRVNADITLHRKAIEVGVKRIRELFESEGAFSAGRAKDILSTSRKFAIPFLEYLDKIQVTRRVGDNRELVE